MWKKLKDNIFKLFHQFTGHNIKCITKMEYFIELMYKPVDGASLGIGRMLFGKYICYIFIVYIKYWTK